MVFLLKIKSFWHNEAHEFLGNYFLQLRPCIDRRQDPRSLGINRRTSGRGYPARTLLQFELVGLNYVTSCRHERDDVRHLYHWLGDTASWEWGLMHTEQIHVWFSSTCLFRQRIHQQRHHAAVIKCNKLTVELTAYSLDCTAIMISNSMLYACHIAHSYWNAWFRSIACFVLNTILDLSMTGREISYKLIMIRSVEVYIDPKPKYAYDLHKKNIDVNLLSVILMPQFKNSLPYPVTYGAAMHSLTRLV